MEKPGRYYLDSIDRRCLMTEPSEMQDGAHGRPRGFHLSSGEVIALCVAFCLVAIVAVPSFLSALNELRGRECSNRLALIYEILSDIAKERGTKPGEEICQAFDLNVRLDQKKAFIKVGAEPDCPDAGDFIIDLHLGPDGKPIPPKCALGSWLFCINDLKDPAILVARLRDARDKVSQYLKGQMSEELVHMLDAYDGSAPPSKDLQRFLVDELNRIIQTESIYDENRFDGIKLNEATRSALQSDASDQDVTHSNRLCLQDVYTLAIAKRVLDPDAKDQHRFVPSQT